jgi:hypothetical protein
MGNIEATLKNPKDQDHVESQIDKYCDNKSLDRHEKKVVSLSGPSEVVAYFIFYCLNQKFNCCCGHVRRHLKKECD